MRQLSLYLTPMSKSSDAQSLQNVWSNSKAFITKRNVDLDKNVLDELIASIFSNGPFYYYIVDFYDMEIKYMNPSVLEIHGLDPETVTFQDILDQIHPEDMDFVTRAEALIWDLLYNKIGKERNQRYKMSYCFRFRVADGSYQLFNHQSIILTADEEGGMAKSLNIHTNISHLTTQNNYKVSAIGMMGEPSYLHLEVDQTNLTHNATAPLFTRREHEIIRLMADGLTSKEISERLFIALDTVKNHRKNILQKARCKNIVQLMAKCITEGLL